MTVNNSAPFQEGGEVHRLIEEHKGRLFRFCYSLTNNQEQAQELFQQTWVRALERNDTFDHRRPFGPWLATIAANLCRDNWRRDRRQGPNVPLESAGELPSPLPTPPEIAESNAELSALRNAISQLDDIYRIPLLLHYVQGAKYREIAQLLDLPLGTIKSRINNAKEQLKKLMERS